ncbi:MAG: hypothetical protein AAFY56_15700 [Pseudomonadota bacterium]
MIAMGLEMRADRMEADVMPAITLRGMDCGHDTDHVNDSEHRIPPAGIQRDRSEALMMSRHARAMLEAFHESDAMEPTRSHTNELSPATQSDQELAPELAKEKCTNELLPSPEPVSEPLNAKYMNELRCNDSNALTGSLVPVPACPGEFERGGSPLSVFVPRKMHERFNQDRP